MTCFWVLFFRICLHHRNLPEWPSQGSLASIQLLHFESLCKEMFIGSPLSPVTNSITALVLISDLIRKGPLKVRSRWNLGATFNITRSPSFNLHSLEPLSYCSFGAFVMCCLANALACLSSWNCSLP